MLLREQLQNKETFSDVESRIADYILQRGADLKYDSARYIARSVYTAPSSVVRLCQKLRFEGYHDFQDAWTAEQSYLSSHFQGLDANRPFEPGDSPLVIANKIGTLYKETIEDTLALADPEMLERAIQYCAAAKTIYLCSAGSQAEIAQGFAEKMMKIGKNVVISGRADLSHYYADLCGPKDCFILISYSGETENILRPAERVKENGLHAIAITSFGANSLSKQFDCVLTISSRERLISNLGSFAAHLTTLYVLDVIYSGVFSRDFEENYRRKKASAEAFEKFRHSSNPLLQED